jgi:hypothetical protein
MMHLSQAASLVQLNVAGSSWRCIMVEGEVAAALGWQLDQARFVVVMS